MFDGSPTLLDDDELKDLKQQLKNGGTPRIEIEADLRDALRTFGTRKG